MNGPAVIGILGGGQLGRMLALAGLPLGLRFRFLEESADCPATDLGEVVEGRYDAPEALARFRRGLSAVTYEFENVPRAAVEGLASDLPVYPTPRALGIAQDRLQEKEAFGALGIATARFGAVDTRQELAREAARLGFPAVLKTRRFGYDGKGQRMIEDQGSLDEAWDALGSVPLIVEEKVDFRRELSIVSVRGGDGDTRHYPLVENVHREGILHLSRAPAQGVTDALQRDAEGIVGRLLESLEYVGVCAVELFDTDQGLLANEMAPRVHNSGHWTQNGADTSQFENHIRAVAGLPLGSTATRGHCAMRNLVGAIPPSGPILAIPGCHLHLYGKKPRPGRKLGHVNVVGETAVEVAERLSRLEEVVTPYTQDSQTP